MLKGFKEFITRGNVIEMAVGFIIGNAFKDIVDSLVNNVINPLIGMIFGKPDFSNMLISLQRLLAEVRCPADCRH